MRELFQKLDGSLLDLADELVRLLTSENVDAAMAAVPQKYRREVIDIIRNTFARPGAKNAVTFSAHPNPVPPACFAAFDDWYARTSR